MKKMLSTQLLAWLALSGWATGDDLSGFGRITVAEAPWGTVYCSEDSQVRPDPSGRRWRLETPKGYVSVFHSDQSWLIQAPNQNLRLEVVQPQQLRVTFNSAQHLLELSPEKSSWQAGRGYLPQPLPASKYRGVLFDNEVVGFYVKLPAQSAKPASWSDLFVIENFTHFPVFQARTPTPQKTASSGPEPEVDPLRLQRPAFEGTKTVEEVLNVKPENDWSYPEGTQQKPQSPLQAIEAPKGKDPLNLRPPPFTRTPTMFEIQEKARRKK